MVAKTRAAKNYLRDKRGERRMHYARGVEEGNWPYMEYLICAENVHLGIQDARIHSRCFNIHDVRLLK